MHAGRNIPFGIREHAMGAIVNGAAAHGGIVKPYGSTFLIFSDYMRGSVRLSALMGLPVVWVWTHDSVGLGEDGPTHQPIEHYAALRAIPNLWVMRPGDAERDVDAWRVALERSDGPVALLLSRQNIPVLDRSRRGARRDARARRLRAVGLRRRAARADPDLDRRARCRPTLEAGPALADEGSARARRLDAVHGAVRGPAARVPRAGAAPRRARRAWRSSPARRSGWWKWVGSEGDVLGLDRFGASAPGTTVLEKLGFTSEDIAARARALLDSRH